MIWQLQVVQVLHFYRDLKMNFVNFLRSILTFNMYTHVQFRNIHVLSLTNFYQVTLMFFKKKKKKRKKNIKLLLQNSYMSDICCHTFWSMCSTTKLNFRFNVLNVTWHHGMIVIVDKQTSMFLAFDKGEYFLFECNYHLQWFNRYEI